MICSVDESRYKKVAQHYEEIFDGARFELIRIADAKSLCEGYNRGLAQSQGESIIFSHDDVEFVEEDVADKIRHALTEYDVVGVAGTDRLIHAKWGQAGPPYLYGQVAHPTPYGFMVGMFGAHKPLIGGMQALDGLFLGFRRSVIHELGWDEVTFDGFHLYDIDTTFRAYLAGYRLAVACDLGPIHDSPGSYDASWEVYANRFHEKHAASLAPSTYVGQWQTTLAPARTKLGVRQLMRPSAWNS